MECAAESCAAPIILSTRKGEASVDLIQWLAAHPLVAILVFLAYFLFVWLIALFFISHISGWQRLAERFRYQGEFTGRLWKWRNGRLRWSSHYGNILILGANREGLYLSVLALFSAYHPPLFLPWSEIEVRQRQYFFFEQTGLILGRDAQIPLWISRRLANEILSYKTEPANSMPATLSSAPIE
jgi:hypothetical protein